MNPTMRAKFKATKVETISETFQNVTMQAVTEAPFDADGKSDDNSFSKWTPTGQITMSISNPDLIGKIVEGQKFYVDFTPAA
jgi:hypothetical protein